MASVAAAMKKSVLPLVILVILLQSRIGNSQDDCPRALNNLNVCAASIIPGNPGSDTAPTPECCSALQAVPHECVCNTVRIASRLPSRCNLPSITCSSS